ncbi:MAG: ATP-binding cassette domain-containing protein [Candidatus Sumerlaeia bacterium]|nr:ATP-binding cassette domain-containing protein [Candidatus Sumerlaeia bacterium]
MSQAAPSTKPLLQVKNLKKWFPIRKGLFSRVVGNVKAVDGISFEIERGTTMALVGESGCGKTTAGRLIMNLIHATEGEVYLGDSPNLTTLSHGEMLPFRRRIQMIFQDPYSSLNPRMPVGGIIGEALGIHGIVPRGPERQKRVEDLLVSVGLARDAARRFPHEFSGGQRQRIGIARALAVEPELIIADEPVSALDVSIQAQVINLLEELQSRIGLAYLFISHDLSVVAHLSTKIGVMYLGRMVELGPTKPVFDTPKHPYTVALLSAVPQIDKAARRKRIILEGDVPSPVNPPPGCHFHPRCPARFAPCDKVAPRLLDVEGGVKVACHLYDPEFKDQAKKSSGNFSKPSGVPASGV